MTETIDSALCDRQLLGAALDDPDSWQTWFAALRAAFGLELSREHRRIFAAISGGRAAPTKRVREFGCLVGRKGGKSRMAAAIACYIALFGRFKLARGEQGLVLVLAMSMDQAKVVFGYCYGFLASSPVLAREIESTTATEIRLKNASSSPRMRTASDRCAVERSAPAYSTRSRIGETRSAPFPISKLTRPSSQAC